MIDSLGRLKSLSISRSAEHWSPDHRHYLMGYRLYIERKGLSPIHPLAKIAMHTVCLGSILD